MEAGEELIEKVHAEELKAQLETHDDVRIQNEDGIELIVENVSYDNLTDEVVIEVASP